jgi:quercetin dioxygenase-like cupin family protein
VKFIPTRPESSAGPAEWFTGTVWFDEVIAGDGPGGLRAFSVHFAPGALTAWHQHSGGQVIYVTEGVGRAQSRAGDVREIRAGDTVVFESGEWHWHGAAPGRFMTHLAMQLVPEGAQPAEWGDPVTDAEYTAPV